MFFCAIKIYIWMIFLVASAREGPHPHRGQREKQESKGGAGGRWQASLGQNQTVYPVEPSRHRNPGWGCCFPYTKSHRVMGWAQTMGTLELGWSAAEGPGPQGLAPSTASSRQASTPLGASRSCCGLLDQPDVTKDVWGCWGPMVACLCRMQWNVVAPRFD